MFKKLFKYFFAGGMAAGVDICFFYVFAKLLDYHYILISVLGFLLATFVNYLLSVKFVFNSQIRFRRNTEFILIYAVSGVGQLIHIGILYVLIDLWIIDKLLSKLVATGIVFIWNFTVRNYFIFAEQGTIKLKLKLARNA
ncbi:MAG: hypothetical protein GVY19_00450 [Bacteroidetes bacterium]|jgi:putative flippase GtrA|nr:hypothetical protein [Bacteroidota bacterium]